jgi:hypothetical protein
LSSFVYHFNFDFAQHAPEAAISIFFPSLMSFYRVLSSTRVRSIFTMAQNTSHAFTLNNRLSIPAIGLGTWQSKPNEVRNAVKYALEHGYRHIDTALNYGNEKEVGEGLRLSGVPREKIWVTTKLDNPWHQCVAEGFQKSLSDLDISYIDLFLIHFPCSTDPNDPSKHLPDWDFVKTWYVSPVTTTIRTV